MKKSNAKDYVEKHNDSQRQQAEQLLFHGTKHLLIMGCAGTGKSTLLKKFRRQTTKKYAVIAPTGVAALNVGGETIHHFFKLWPGVNVGWIRRYIARLNQEKLLIYQKMEVLIIDEISMVRADLFDLIDVFLRCARKDKRPFGGVRLIMFGDLYQLPPVVTDQEKDLLKKYATPFFFDADVWPHIEGNLLESNLDHIELKTIYRQQDSHFIDFLQQVRHNQIKPSTLEEINNSVVNTDLDFEDPCYQRAVILTSTNSQADKINFWQLSRIDSQAFFFQARQKGKFDAKFAPVPEKIFLKIGARIMMTINDPESRWINGSTGWIRDLISDPETGANGVLVELDPSEISSKPQLVSVYPHIWEINHSFFNPETKNIESEVLGKYRQLPLRMAWAVTIHKSQGQTFDQVIIDFSSRSFASGQTYVALSRCRTLEGLHLTRPLVNEDILLDQEIVNFIKRLKSYSE